MFMYGKINGQAQWAFAGQGDTFDQSIWGIRVLGPSPNGSVSFSTTASAGVLGCDQANLSYVYQISTNPL